MIAPAYLEDASGFRGDADRLLIPAGTGEVASILVAAHQAGTPVTVAGAGTGVTGGRVAQGGWVMSTGKLRRLEIHAGHAATGAGVALLDLHAAAARSRQLYPPDPTEWTASVGGTIATNASGSRSFLYGSTRRYIRALTVVLAEGRVLNLRRGDAIDFDVPAIPLPRTTKNTAGYPLVPGMDWIDLFCGSEGTLGVVTEAELELLPAPGELFTGVVFFSSDDDAVAAADAWRAVPRLRMIEYFDSRSLGLLRSRFPETPAAGAALLLEQEGSGEDWIERLEAAHADTEASWFAVTAADRERFRRFRHALPEAVNDLVRRNGFMKLGSDYAVPVERNLEMLRYYHERLQGERYVLFGHIGDAHLHLNILPSTQAEFDHGQELMLDFARQAVALGGTVSAEHGLGKRKAHLLEIQYAPEHIAAMRAVKQRLDPHAILGRGNLFTID